MSDQRFDPMKELSNLRNSVGRIIEEGSGSVGKLIEQGIQTVQSASSGTPVKLDVYEHDDIVTIRTNALDGLAPDSIEVSMEGDILTIKGETRPEEVPPRASYLLQERRFGPFVRSVVIPIPVRSAEAKAKLKHNVLTVTLPVDTERYQDITITPTE